MNLRKQEKIFEILTSSINSEKKPNHKNFDKKTSCKIIKFQILSLQSPFSYLAEIIKLSKQINTTIQDLQK